MNTANTNDADYLAECLTRLALDLNLNLGNGDYTVLARIGALPEREMLDVLAASHEFAALMLTLAVRLATGTAP